VTVRADWSDDGGSAEDLNYNEEWDEEEEKRTFQADIDALQDGEVHHPSWIN
jgi:hypothetical protein